MIKGLCVYASKITHTTNSTLSHGWVRILKGTKMACELADVFTIIIFGCSNEPMVSMLHVPRHQSYIDGILCDIRFAFAKMKNQNQKI